VAPAHLPVEPEGALQIARAALESASRGDRGEARCAARCMQRRQAAHERRVARRRLEEAQRLAQPAGAPCAACAYPSGSIHLLT